MLIPSNESPFEALFEFAPDAMLIADDAGRYVSVNPAACALLGYARGELLTMSVWDLTPGVDRELGSSLWASFLEAGTQSGPYRLTRRDGTLVEAEYRAVANVLPGRHLSILRDVSARRAAERALEAERLRLRQLFEQAPGFVAIVDGPDHVFRLANASYRALVGRQDLVGRPVREALPEVVEQGFIQLLDRVFATGEPFVGRGMPVRFAAAGDGAVREVYVDFVFQPITEPDGSISGIFCEGHDITDQKLIQIELQQLNASLEERVAERTAELMARNEELQSFASAASHDLQEPLRKVRTFLGLLKEELPDLTPTARGYIERVDSAVDRMAQFIKDLLDLSRVTSAQTRSREVDLNGIVGEVLSDIEVQLREAGARVDVERLGSVLADPIQVRQLFQNLIGNAVKFRRRGVPPRVTVSREAPDEVERPGEPVRICVRDNGIGLDEKYAERIFQPFQRLHSRSLYSGSGMGLAICHRIVHRHGGTIEVHSTPGHGSTFVVSLPTPRAPESCTDDR